MDNAALLFQNKELELVAYGQSIIDAEAKTLSLVARGLGKSFAESVLLLNGLSGTQRVVCAGVGKASFVAEKAAATLSSTGCPSYVLHPLEALHGDIGSVCAGDVAILFSNTGETAEVLQLGTALKSMGLTIICVTSTTASSLAQLSHQIISIGRVDEVGPLKLAPTASTTAMLAVADALAMSVLSLKNFHKEDFLRLHPGGMLGKKLLPITAIMRTGERLCTAGPTDTCRVVIHKISETIGKPGAAAIVDANNRLLGIFTDGDMRRCLNNSSTFLDEPVSAHMGRDPKRVSAQMTVADAQLEITRHSIDQVLVCDNDGTLLGLVDIQDAAKL